jgi:UDP-N-acetylglucosamine 1-carboxyvinyltransferase
MDKLLIKGPAKLSGSISISRAKNAYLPILSAVLLSDKPIHLKNIPELRDINTMIKLLGNLGVKVEKKGNITTFDASNLTSHEATYDLVKTMRASIFTLGPILTRMKKAKVSLPGGCAIGSRPIDLHLSSLEKLGAKIKLESGYVAAETDGLVGAHVPLAFPSVGATENIMMAAVFAKGITTIENAAKEPEIDDLAHFLNKMGAKVSGIGTSNLTIEGVTELKEVEYEAIGDRIEAATYVMAGLITKSEIDVIDFDPKHIEFVLNTLKSMGAKLEVGETSVRVFPSDLKGVSIDTAPYPGYPTDAQAQLIALATQVEGTTIVSENIFENRYMHVPELNRLGAKIQVKGKTAVVEGGGKLKSAPIMCTDLRASAALVLAALATEGETEVRRVYHLDRGYEKLADKLQKLGVEITRINE